MPENNDLGIFSDLVGAIVHFGERVAVQRQLTAIGFAILLSWLLAGLLWFLIGRRAAAWAASRFQERQEVVVRYTVSILKNILFPTLVLLALGRIDQTFMGRGWHAGLLNGFIFLFWVILAYRLLLGILYAHLKKPAAQRYHHRFLAPLLGILILAWFLNHLIPLRRLAAVEVWQGTANPITLGALFIATVGFYFWFDGSGVVQDLARFSIRPISNVQSGSLEAALIIGRYILIGVGIYVVFTVLGFDSTTLAFLTAGLSVGIGFGLKEVIGNLVSGVLLLVDQSLRPGDVISIDGKIGTVRHVGIRASIVKTLNNVDVVVPNQTFLTSAVTSYSQDDEPVRMLIPFETSDAHTPHEVRAAMLKVAHAHPLVVDRPGPQVFYLATGDTSRKYELAVWYVDPLMTVPLHSELYYLIQDEFDNVGINPATPQRDLNIMRVPVGVGGQVNGRG